jgi:hypothetical protein
MRRGATVDVSGGLLTHGAGYVQTSMLSLGGRATPISSARADINYDGVYTGTATVASKWRAPQTYSSGIFNPARGYDQNSYFEGAPAGTASLSAPSLALAGNLVGKSYTSPDQRTAPPALGSLRLAFLGEKNAGSVAAPVFVNHSPFAPEFRLAAGRSRARFCRSLNWSTGNRSHCRPLFAARSLSVRPSSTRMKVASGTWM